MPLYEPVTSTTTSAALNDFRLTGVTATPVMTADSTALSTIYLTPYTGNMIALYNGASWDLITSVEVSLAVTGRTTDLPFDIFGYNNAGVVTLEFLNWTNATSRATGLTRQDGVWTKTGDATRRYLGTCRPRSATTFHWVTTGTDLPTKLDIWNVSNRVFVDFTLKATTDTWTYTTATWRQAQASVNYQVDMVAGIQESTFHATIVSTSINSAASGTNVPRGVSMGLDSTTTPSGIFGSTGDPSTVMHSGSYTVLMAIGRHFVAWLEYSTALSTTTWHGDNGGNNRQSGITGSWEC